MIQYDYYYFTILLRDTRRDKNNKFSPLGSYRKVYRHYKKG